LVSKNNRFLVLSEFVNSIHSLHELFMDSSLGETTQHFLLSLTFKCKSSSDHRGYFLLSSSHSCSFIRISLGDNLSGLRLGLFENLGLNKIGLSDNLIVLKIGLSVDLVNDGIGLSCLLTSQPLNCSFQTLDLFRFVKLFKGGLFLLVLSLFQMDLLSFLFFLSIVGDSLVEGESFSFKRGLELIDRGLLHRISNIIVKGHTSDHNSFHQNTFVGQVLVQKVEHTKRVSLSSQVVSIFGLHCSCHSSYSLHDIGVDELVLLGNVCNELLNVV